MAIVSSSELLAAVRDFVGDRTDDAAIKLIEDVADTLADNDTARSTDWEAKYNELDTAWRKRYRDRFLSREDDTEQVIRTEEKQNETVEATKKTYDDLFEES